MVVCMADGQEGGGHSRALDPVVEKGRSDRVTVYGPKLG